MKSLLVVIAALVLIVNGQRPTFTPSQQCQAACDAVANAKPGPFSVEVKTSAEDCFEAFRQFNVPAQCLADCITKMDEGGLWTMSKCDQLVRDAGTLPMYNTGHDNTDYVIKVSAPGEIGEYEVLAYDAESYFTPVADLVGKGSATWIPKDNRILNRAWFLEHDDLAAELENDIYEHFYGTYENYFRVSKEKTKVQISKKSTGNLGSRINLGMISSLGKMGSNLEFEALKTREVLAAVGQMFYNLGICRDTTIVPAASRVQSGLTRPYPRSKVRWVETDNAWFGSVHNDQRREAILDLYSQGLIMVNIWVLLDLPVITDDCPVEQEICNDAPYSHLQLYFAALQRPVADFDLMTKQQSCQYKPICKDVDQSWTELNIRQSVSMIRQFTYYVKPMVPKHMMVWLYTTHGKAEILNDERFMRGRRTIDIRFNCEPSDQSIEALKAAKLIS